MRNWIDDRGGRYSFVTVTFREDVKLLRLQARSLARYLDQELTDEIIVIENSREADAGASYDELLHEYGELAPCVRIVDAHQIVVVPDGVSGWFAQQVLKLSVSRFVRNRRYVALDAKNHLVHALTRTFLESADGRMRLYPMDYRSHPMRSFFETTLRYCGLDPSAHISRFLPTTTPFPLPTEHVRDLVAALERRERVPFPIAFLKHKSPLGEFFLFGASQIAIGRDLESLYDLTGLKCPAIWPDTSPAEALRAIQSSRNPSVPFLSLHRRALPNLDNSVRAALARHWVAQDLFETSTKALRFLEPH